MRALAGALLILTSEQAFSHALLITVPYQAVARMYLLPFAIGAILLGIGLLVVGMFRDQKRALTGAVLILASEQAFSHALMIGFPHQVYAQTILFPAAATAAVIGVGFLLLGIARDSKTP